jgi:CheY-like chemotaxis protein
MMISMDMERRTAETGSVGGNDFFLGNDAQDLFGELSVDEDGRISEINPHLADILEIGQDEAIGTPIYDLVTAEDRLQCRLHYVLARETGTWQTCLLRFKYENHHTVTLELKTEAVLDEQRQVWQFRSSARDALVNRVRRGSREYDRKLKSDKSRQLIMVVDDEEMILKIVKIYLERDGYSVVTYNNGREALDDFAKNADRVGAVILDLMMPGISGIQCYEQMIRMKPDASIICMSGSIRENESLQMLPKVKGFMPKPLQFDALLSKLEQVLG